MAGIHREIDVLNDDALFAGRRHADGFYRQLLLGCLQQRLRLLRRQLLEQTTQPPPALARGDKALPVRNGEIDRRERARAEDRARDDDACGRLLVDDEIGTDREHGRLQHHAHHLGDGAEPAGDVAGALVAGDVALVGLAPAFGEATGHAHGDQHLGVAAA
jgi:hypothetical protein